MPTNNETANQEFLDIINDIPGIEFHSFATKEEFVENFESLLASERKVIDRLRFNITTDYQRANWMSKILEDYAIPSPIKRRNGQIGEREWH